MESRKASRLDRPKKNGKLLWLLDNGHGVDTPGKRSPMLTDGRQFLEYEFNREIVSKMREQLDASDLSSICLVPEKKDVPLGIRVQRANSFNKSKPCVLVSVHSNAYGDGLRFTIPRGIASFYFENSEMSRRLAEVFQENLIQKSGWRDRGVKPGNFQILRKTSMPAVLTETGFYTNREQVEYLLDPDWREHIASAHVEAITEIESKGPEFFQS